MEYLNRRRIKTAQSAVFSSRFVTDNHLIRHAKRAVLNVHRFNIWYGVNYSKEDTDTTLKYAKKHDLTIYEAMDYLSVCHYCGRDTIYAYGYCKSRFSERL